MILSVFVGCLQQMFSFLVELYYGILTLFTPVKVRKTNIGPLVFLYINKTGGGIHPNIDIQEAWEHIHAQAPHLVSFPRFRITYDDQFNRPFGETCRSSLGYIVSTNNESNVHEWKRHPLVTSHTFRVGYFPANYCCMIAEFPYCGHVSHAIALVKIMLWQVYKQRMQQLPRTKVPGVMQICDINSRKISFICPLEDRDDMLPF